MADDQLPPGQPKATEPAEMEVEALAIRLLKGVFAESTRPGAEREWGGVIYRQGAAGRIGHTGPIEGDSSHHVDVGKAETNFGCPAGAKPVAWYHTHPVKFTYSVDNGVVTRIRMGWDVFEDGDLAISEGNNLIGYVIDPDKRIWRYKPPPGQMIDGKFTPEATAQGSWGPLND